MTYHAMFSLYIMTGLLALVISVSLFCKSVAEAKERNKGSLRGNRCRLQNDYPSGKRNRSVAGRYLRCRVRYGRWLSLGVR